jgi:hypothetical protein
MVQIGHSIKLFLVVAMMACCSRDKGTRILSSAKFDAQVEAQAIHNLIISSFLAAEEKSTPLYISEIKKKLGKRVVSITIKANGSFQDSDDVDLVSNLWIDGFEVIVKINHSQHSSVASLWSVWPKVVMLESCL